MLSWEDNIKMDIEEVEWDIMEDEVYYLLRSGDVQSHINLPTFRRKLCSFLQGKGNILP
jgi:hypothetical protein